MEEGAVVIRGASQYPIWRSNSMVPPEGLGGAIAAAEERVAALGRLQVAENQAGRFHGGSLVETDANAELTPPASTSADRALAAVADVASIVMPPGQLSSSAIAQVHFDQSALKLATAIKNLADGIHNLERRQDESDIQVRIVAEQMRSVEESTISLKSEQMAVVTTCKKALRQSKQQTQFREFEEGIEPRSRGGTCGSIPASSSGTMEERLQQVEKKVEALLQWQEDEGAKGISQIVQRNSGGNVAEELREQLQTSARYIHTNCGMLRALQESVARLEESADFKASDRAAVGVQQLWMHLQENYYSRHQLDPLLQDLEGKASHNLAEDHSQRAAPRLHGADHLPVYGQDAGPWLQGVEARIERNEARLDKSIVDLSDRLDPIQDFVDQQRLSSWQGNRQLPEVGQKLDQLWAQCQYYFSKVKEHDVHFGFFRTSFESHKQNCLDSGESYEHPARLRPTNNSIFPSSWAVKQEDGVGAGDRGVEEPLISVAGVQIDKAATADAPPVDFATAARNAAEPFSRSSVLNNATPSRVH